MIMFGLFRSSPFTDPQLGELVRSRGKWRGHFDCAGDRVPVIVDGSKKEPDGESLAEARRAIGALDEWRGSIARALFEHLEPYAESIAAGELPAPEDFDLSSITSPADVWPHATLLYVSAGKLDGVMTTELGYSTSWDEEHTLGVRFRSGQFAGLCGSVLAP